MDARIAALLFACGLAAATVRSHGQEADNLPESLSREQWQQRVDEARRRSEEFVATARNRSAMPLPANREDIEARDRAMQDPTLQQGDLVATEKGLLLMFVGRDERHQPSDFVPAPDRKARPSP
jgi:hypothetical protein